MINMAKLLQMREEFPKGLPKLTFKEQVFCLSYMLCDGNQTKAYMQAYGTGKAKLTTVTPAASRLMARPCIKKEIARLQKEYQEKYDVTIEYLTDGLKEAADLAREDRDISNLRQSQMDLAKLHGLIIDKKVVTGKIDLSPQRGMIAQRFANRVNESKK